MPRARRPENKPLGAFIAERRLANNYTLAEIGKFLKKPTTTYQRKEINGDFREEELRKLSEKLKFNLSTALKLAENPAMEIGDGMKFLVEKAIRNSSVTDTIIYYLAETLSYLRVQNKVAGLPTTITDILEEMKNHANAGLEDQINKP
jgi:hypothetical protein